MRNLLIPVLGALLSLAFVNPTAAQKKIVVMGSSTAYGNGASSVANSWVGKLASYFQQNTSDTRDTILYNIALGNQTTYNQMPTGFTPPPNRPVPDPDHNVTKALSYAPDVIIINLPTNDVSYGFPMTEVMDNFRAMYAAITATGTECFITTTQPRDFPDQMRLCLRQLTDSINNNFGLNAIDVWTEEEEPATSFELQRSQDGITFETIQRIAAKGLLQRNSYNWTDNNPKQGKNLYRLKIIESNTARFSGVVNISTREKAFAIQKLYIDNASNLVVDIAIQKNQAGIISIVNSGGSTVQKQSKQFNGPAEKISLSLANLAKGQYFLAIRMKDGNYISRAFAVQ